jgi:hypothetical protein
MRKKSSVKKYQKKRRSSIKRRVSSKKRRSTRSRCQKGGYSPFVVTSAATSMQPKIPFQLTGGYANTYIPMSPYTRPYVKSYLGGDGEGGNDELIGKIQTVINDLKDKLTNLCNSSTSSTPSSSTPSSSSSSL